MQTKNTNSNKKIAIDLENTIINIIPPFMEILRKEYNIEISEKKLLRKYNLKETTGLENKNLERIFKEIWKPPYSELMLLYNNCIPVVIEKISRNFSIDILTASKGNKKTIKNWLYEHKIIYDNIIFVNSAEDKNNYAFETIIEDYPEVAKLALKNNKKVILVDWYYNRNEPELEGKKNFFRIKSWNEIPKIMDLKKCIKK